MKQKKLFERRMPDDIFRRNDEIRKSSLYNFNEFRTRLSIVVKIKQMVGGKQNIFLIPKEHNTIPKKNNIGFYMEKKNQL